jgi:hypothetical protein
LLALRVEAVRKVDRVDNAQANTKPPSSSSAGSAEPALAVELEVVSLDNFVAADEPGVDPLLGAVDDVVIGPGFDAMFYGDGGAGKTTLAIDLTFHLAAGDAWLGIPVPRPMRVLLIENEGPRPLYRAKLRRKREGWTGSPVGDRIRVLERPWGRLSLAKPAWRASLAEAVERGEVDVVVAGPVSRLGMNEAGTLQEVRDFMVLVDEVRERSGRRLAVVLIHHENKGGKVSGAWEGSGDTLFHVLGQGHGRLRLYFQKARWSSSHHATTLQLVWAEGEGFELAEGEPARPERTWDDIATFVLEHGGCAWNKVDKAVPGQREYLQRRRDQMLADGLLVNAGTPAGFELWHRDDPARPTLDATGSEAGTGAEPADSDPGGGTVSRTGSAVPLHRAEPVPGEPPPADREATTNDEPGEKPEEEGRP